MAKITWKNEPTADELLQKAKKRKIEELDLKCSEEILQGFTHTINGIVYHFSMSIMAQTNFQETGDMFKEGAITSEKWTVLNTESGKVERIDLDKTTFNEVRSSARQIVRDNISKLRDNLQPQVESATTITEVESVVW